MMRYGRHVMLNNYYVIVVIDASIIYDQVDSV